MVTTQEAQKKFSVIGTRPIRHDGLDKVTGRAIYGADIKLPGMVYGAVLRSPHAHARILRLDTSKAERMLGVLSVLTGADMPDAENKLVDLGEGMVNFMYASDRLMARDSVRYKGHPVAAVAATDPNLAALAAAAVEVEYEPLPPVLDVDSALASGAVVVHKDIEGDDLGEKVTNTNLADHFRHEFGDLDQGFASADTIVEQKYFITMVHQGYIEPQNATAIWDQEDRVRVWTSTQGAFTARREISGILRLDESRVKVTPLEIGGGFGGKIPVYLEPLAALLSKKARGRPVRMVMDRPAVFDATGPTPGGWVLVKMGVNSDGMITAAQADLRLEAGAYPGGMASAGAQCVFAPYDIPNTRIDGYNIIVNKPKTAPYRAPGSTHVAFATESVVAEICEELGMDPVEFRIKNAAKEGTRRADGPIFPRIGMVECLEAVKNSDHWNSPLQLEGVNGKVRGRGLASGYWFNIGLKSSVNLSVNVDGTVGT